MAVAVAGVVAGVLSFFVAAFEAVDADLFAKAVEEVLPASLGARHARSSAAGLTPAAAAATLSPPSAVERSFSFLASASFAWAASRSRASFASISRSRCALSTGLAAPNGEGLLLAAGVAAGLVGAVPDGEVAPEDEVRAAS